jgi:hypothetical protein
MSFSLEDFDDTKFLKFVEELYLELLAYQYLSGRDDEPFLESLEEAKDKYRSYVAERFSVFYAGADKDADERKRLLLGFQEQEKKRKIH